MFALVEKMVTRLAVVFLGLIAVVAIGGLVFQLGNQSTTGSYAASGGGRYYYGPQIAQLEPREACIYSGFEPVEPIQVRSNKYGTYMALCKSGSSYVEIPLVQTVIVP